MEEITQILSDLDARIAKTIERLLKQGESKQIILSIVDKEIDNYIASVGVDKVMQKYVDGLTMTALTTVSGYTQAMKKDIIESVGAITEQLANTYRDQILGYFQGNVGKLKTELLNGLLSGTPTSEISKRLKQTFTRVSGETSYVLTDANINTVINTSYTNVSRVATAKAFEGTEQRFEYVGGVIPTSSQQCEWLMNNQAPEGYTKAEIDAGIDTPYGVIDWQGRQPNYNCIHAWYPVDNIYAEAAPIKESGGNNIKLSPAQFAKNKEIYNKHGMFDYEKLDSRKFNRLIKDTDVQEFIKANNMTPDEVAPIYNYTSNGYSRINPALRSGDKLDDVYQGFNNNLNHSLNKIDDYKGISQRMETYSFDRYKGLKAGDELNVKEFWSSGGEGSSFINPKYFDENGTLFHIKSKHGKDIRLLSNVSGENEILFRSGSRFKITKTDWYTIKKYGMGEDKKMLEIFLEEI